MAKSTRVVSSIILCLLLLLAIAFALAFYQWHYSSSPLRLQQARLLPVAKALPEFQLQDHQQQPFGREQLLGRWHLLSYGYTYCPDICPLTLAKLSYLQWQLQQQQQFADLELLFYTIDAQRDTAEELAQYLSFFAADFRGLRPDPVAPEQHLPFEKALSLKAMLTEDLQSDAGYQVAHGVMLYLLNPKAELQAVFMPVSKEGTLPEFDMDSVLEDYLQIRQHLDGRFAKR